MVVDKFDLNKMCHVCTKSSFSLESLYENDKNGVSTLEKLQVICGINIDENCPKQICKECRNQLNACYDFRIMCRTTHKILSTYRIENENETEIRYFIEIDDDFNETELQLSDIERYFKTPKKTVKKKMKTKLNKKCKTDDCTFKKRQKCKVCKKEFGSELRVKLHMQRIHKQIYLAECKVVCPKCGMKFQHVRNLKRHLVYHNKNSYFGCPFCEKKLFSKISWRKHIKCHDSKTNVICKICNKMISSTVSNVYHMEYHKTKKNLTEKTFFSCYTCTLDFQHFADLEKHCFHNHCLDILQEHDYPKEQFDFIKESSEFEEIKQNGQQTNDSNNSDVPPNKINLIDSVMNINNSVTFRCNICSRFYKNLNDLNFHVSECFAKINRPKSFMCDICGKCFVSSCMLTTHKAGHSTARPYICDICGQRFKWHNDLTNHKNRIHEHFRPYICKVCGKKCGTSATLKSHMRLHTGEKPYVCRECGVCFAQNSSLKEHMFKHTGGQESSCPICNKVFKTPLRLRTHIKRHNTQRKLFPCDLCGRMFTEKSSVRKHKVKIHTDVNLC